MLMLDETALLMIQEGGFTPCFVGDIAEGDTIPATLRK